MTRVWSNGTKQQEEPGGYTPQVTTSETDFNMKEARSEEEEQEEKEKKSFFGLCFSEDLEKELAEQSKVALKMIYFFQVLPFYILQFTSGMALGNIYMKSNMHVVASKKQQYGLELSEIRVRVLILIENIFFRRIKKLELI